MTITHGKTLAGAAVPPADIVAPTDANAPEADPHLAWWEERCRLLREAEALEEAMMEAFRAIPESIREPLKLIAPAEFDLLERGKPWPTTPNSLRRGAKLPLNLMLASAVADCAPADQIAEIEAALAARAERVNSIIHEWEEREAARKHALDIASADYARLSDAERDASDRVFRMDEMIAKTKARTLPGLAVQANAVRLVVEAALDDGELDYVTTLIETVEEIVARGDLQS
ncbi:MAG: hypothetical protein HQL41_17435 [Alphaproteobacteria bacterium]|nr:hypothetical protein [Alphaproteobacteria bacterium]